MNRDLGGETAAPAPAAPADEAGTLSPDTGAAPTEGAMDLTTLAPPATPDAALPGEPDLEPARRRARKSRPNPDDRTTLAFSNVIES